MRIALHLLNSLKGGGAENVALNYSAVLKECAAKSIFVAIPDSADYENMLVEKDVEVSYHLTGKLLKRADYIFVHSNKNLLKLLFFFCFINMKQKKIIYIQHLYFKESKFGILSWLINFVCTDFILITPRTRSLVEKYITIPVHQIVNFYANKYNRKEYADIRHNVRLELDVTDDVKLVMFSAIFKPGKGLADCLKLAAQFKDNHTMKFLIAGGGEEQFLLDAYAYDNVITVGCVNDVERYLIASDVYLFLSLLPEMLPMALVEAINVDIPVLAYSTITNDFLLSGKSSKSLEEVGELLRTNNVPCGFEHYDMDYAKSMFQQIL